MFAASGNALIGEESNVSAFVMAPVLWSGYEEDSIDAASVAGSVPLQSGEDTLRVSTWTFALAALPGVATASADATQIDATLHSQF